MLDDILRLTIMRRASDVHLTSGRRPIVRIDGELGEVPEFAAPLSAQWLGEALLGVMSRRRRADFETANEIDFSYTTPDGERFRVNAFLQQGGLAAAFRHIPASAPSLKTHRIPAIVGELALRPSGLVLVTGPTGSGKSSTLAAMVDIINTERAAHVISIEDPVEFLHESRRSLIHQREIGADTESFANALRYVLRQDPDVILLGELRDLESISVALSAAETGQLVLATLHTQSAMKSINRILDAFPAERQGQVRSQLADTLRGIVSQRLLPRVAGRGRALATEVLVQTSAISNMIREGQVQQLYSALYSGTEQGMSTMDQSLHALVASGEVSYETARAHIIESGALNDLRILDPGSRSAGWHGDVDPNLSSMRGQ